MKQSLFMRTAVLGGALAVASSASATIALGVYSLHNHPDGSVRPPAYGARLDELYNVTSGHDEFTFDFDHAGAAMFLDYTGSTIRIYGQAYGGRDVGSDWANDAYRGMYTFSFTYRYGVGIAPGDDDLLVDPADRYNYGSIMTPLGDRISLWDGHYDSDQPDFRFGNEDNDLGHRGYNGLSGWGWLFHGQRGDPYVPSSDWLFTATLVPTPGSAVLLLGSLVAMRRRR